MIVTNGGGSTPTPVKTTTSYTSAIGAAKEAYKTGGVEAAKAAYSGVMAEGIAKASSPATSVQTPPSSTCPPGERLYKVRGTHGTVYVTASDTASKDEIQALAGQAGFVTSVLSPEAYVGGEYPASRVVTTVDGQQYTVPVDVKAEAVAEYVNLYGAIPKTGAPEAQKTAYREAVSGIQSQMEAGTYVSPLSVPIPEVQKIAETSNLTYSQALMEAKTISDQAIRNYSTTGSCAPLGMTKNEAIISSAYLEALGRKPEADIIKSYYVSLGGTLENQLKKAEDVNLSGVYASMAPYRTGTSYNLPMACAEGKCSRAGLATMGFSPDIIAGALAAGEALKNLFKAPTDLYNPDTGMGDIAGLVTSGNLTENQAKLLFGDENVTRALTTYVGPESLEGGVGYDIAPEQKSIWGNIKDVLRGPGVPEWAPQWLGRFQGLSGVPPLDIAHMIANPAEGSMFENIYRGVQLGGITTGAVVLAPIVAPKLVPAVVKTGLTFAGISTAAAGIYGAVTPPKEETWEGAQQRIYQEYLKSPELAASIEAGKAEGKDLRAPTYEEFQQKFGEVYKYEPLSYKEGILGAMGRGWEAQTDFFGRVANIAGEPSLARPITWAPYLASGFMGYLASPATAAAAYPYAGNKAWLIAIPHFGPTAIQPFVVPGTPTWQKVAGVGFSILPYAAKPISIVAGKVGGFTSRLPVIGPVQRGVGGVVRGVGTVADIATFGLFKPISATFERVAPWQLAYTISGGIGKLIPATSGLYSTGTRYGWWGRQKPIPLGDIWGEWYKSSAGPAGSPAAESGRITTRGGEVYDVSKLTGSKNKPVTTKALEAAHKRLLARMTPEQLARYRSTQATRAATVKAPSAEAKTAILKAEEALRTLNKYSKQSGFETPNMAADLKADLARLKADPSLIEDPVWQRWSRFTEEITRTYEGYLQKPSPAPLTEAELAAAEVPEGLFATRAISEPAAIVTEAPSWYQRLTGRTKAPAGTPAYMVNPLAEARFFNPQWTALNVALPALTVAAMSILPGFAAAPVDVSQIIDMNLQTAQDMLDRGQISQEQFNLLEKQIQSQSLTKTSQQAQQDIQRTVQQALTLEQQEQFKQYQEQQQFTEETTSLPQLQQEPFQEPFREPFRHPWEWQQEWEDTYQWQPDLFEGEVKPPDAEEEVIPPPVFPLLLPEGAGSPAYTSPTGGGMRRALAGGQWIMPGLILSMPDPFGTGRQKIQLTKRRARRYGAREPRLALGGLKI